MTDFNLDNGKTTIYGDCDYVTDYRGWAGSWRMNYVECLEVD